MTRRNLIAGNWKMNLTLEQSSSLAQALRERIPGTVDVAVFPPFPWITEVNRELSDSPVSVGAQNCHWEPSGAFTGEVSATMLAGVCDFIIAGHSERRHIFGESDEQVARKVSAIIGAGIHPILCVGETLDERQSGDAEQVVVRQLETGLANVSPGQLSSLTVAYEPVWAIGTGVAATSEDAQEMSSIARSWLSVRYGELGSEVRILYGGSMTPDNAFDLLTQHDIDGGLVGGASLKSESFLAIVAAAEQATTI